MPKKKSIHLVERLGLMRELSPNPPKWESGYWWRIGEANAEALREGRICFHKKQKEPSYGGGIIKDYRIERGGQYNGRYVFIYCPDPSCEGILAPPGKWFQGRNFDL